MLKARTGIDMFKRKVNQFARSLSIVLHTYQVANLYYLRLGFFTNWVVAPCVQTQNKYLDGFQKRYHKDLLYPFPQSYLP